MASSKDPSEKDMISPRSLSEIMNLLMKLNDKIREKFRPSPKNKKEGASEQLDVVIMILSHEERKAQADKKSRTVKADPVKGDWIERLFSDIEGGIPHRKKA